MKDPEYKGCVLETDTDGILIDKEPDIDAVNRFISDKVRDLFSIENCSLEMECERFERGFIHKMKNYILFEKDKKEPDGMKAIVHGAYFVSSRAPKVYDDAVQIIVEYVRKDDLVEEHVRKTALDIRMRPVEDFIQRVRMSKDVKEYTVAGRAEVLDDNDPSGASWKPITTETVYTDNFSISGSQIVGLALQMRRISGSIPEKGTIISYLICKDPVTGRKTYEYRNIRDDTQIGRLNYDEYEKMISKLFDAAAIATFDQTRQEEDWLEDIFNLL